MFNQDATAVFFDIGDTLGIPTIHGQPPHLIGIDLFPYILDTLKILKNNGLMLGVISNTGNDTKTTINPILRKVGLLDFLDSNLLVYSAEEGMAKSSPEIFHKAALRAKLQNNSGQNLFVGEDAKERQVALSAGWQVCPHPLLVTEVLAGQSLHYIRVTRLPETISLFEDLQKMNFVPMHIEGEKQLSVIGLTSKRVTELIKAKYSVEFLGAPDLPLRTNLFLFRDEVAPVSQPSLSEMNSESSLNSVALAQNSEGLIVALSSDSCEEVSFTPAETKRHGHRFKLTADIMKFPIFSTVISPSTFAPRQPILTDDIKEIIASITGTEILETARRYSGMRPLDGVAAKRITSRHVQHVDNARAVAQIVNDLNSIGKGRLKVQLQPFTHFGAELFNVEAELAGTTSELVIVSAHLDSTAENKRPYDPSIDLAPGLDDDASGLSAVLAIASQFVRIVEEKGPLNKTVRFLLFNAEEQGLVGSQAYARRAKVRSETVSAVWQMDMIGYNKIAPMTWEVHAGFRQSRFLEKQSRRLADLVQDAAGQISPELDPVQIYDSQGLEGDPADGRSDHSSFHIQGYPAVAISEDFFASDGIEHAEPNPNYHKPEDTFMDEIYAAAITRVIAAAAWITSC